MSTDPSQSPRQPDPAADADSPSEESLSQAAAPAAPPPDPQADVGGEPAPSVPTPPPPPSPPTKTKVLVGSRRGPDAPTSSQPQVPVPPALPIDGPTGASPAGGSEAARESRPPKDIVVGGQQRPQRTVPTPSRRDRLTADLELELEAAFGDASIDELVGDSPSKTVGQPLEIDSRARASVVKLHADNVFFTVDGRNEGVASVRQFREPPSIGDAMDVIVTGYHADDGLYELAIPGAAVSVQDWSDVHEGAVVEARITGSNTGGLECLVGGLRGFIPASQIEMFHVDNYADYYDKKLPCVVTEANERKRNLVLSHRALLEREREEKRKELLESLAVGDVLEGTVTSIRPFGAFVDLGGIDGLIHISQLSWDRVEDPAEVVEVGQKVRVRLEKIDPQTGKIGLSYRNLLEHPWQTAEERFPAGSLVKGLVTRTAKFGAFVKLAPGIEGLVHISELAHHRVVQVTNVVHEGDEIEVKVLNVDGENQKMSLSLKDARPMPVADKEASAEEEPDQPVGPPVVPPRNEPLKGGTDRSSGGDSFGLKW
jgi:small subunit ribosomal protein S1